MQTLFKTVLALLFILLAGCAGDAVGVKDENLSRHTSAPVQYQILKSGVVPADYERYMAREESVAVFRSDREDEAVAFADLYRRLTGETAPAFRGTVIVATMGVKSSGGYSLVLDSVTEVSGVAEVRLKRKSPPPDALVTTALTNPYIVIFLPDYFGRVKVNLL